MLNCRSSEVHSAAFRRFVQTTTHGPPGYSSGRPTESRSCEVRRIRGPLAKRLVWAPNVIQPHSTRFHAPFSVAGPVPVRLDRCSGLQRTGGVMATAWEAQTEGTSVLQALILQALIRNDYAH